MRASAASQPWAGRAVGHVSAVDADPPTLAGPSAARWSADEALTHLYTSQYRPLVRLATLLLHDPGQAEEIAQDAFVALHEHWGRLRDPDRAVAYLRRSVANRARSALRHRGVVDRFLWRTRHPETVPGSDAGLFGQAEVLAAVRALPARQREALVLRYYLDLSQVQAAEVMGVSEGAVKSHTSRALAALRRELGVAP